MAGGQLPHRDQGSSALGSARTRLTRQGLIAAAVAAVAFACYYATLLPGLDLGDSASFQTAAGSLDLTPRHAYPLYYALGNVFVWLIPGEPARALNLASAACGALAAGMMVLVGARLSRSTAGGAASGGLLAFSYTFWSQAVTAEVYTLHLLVAGASLLALLAWGERQTAGRLALFYAVFALGFGNHLSMVLLLPAFAAYLLMKRHAGPGDPLRGRLLVLAAVIAAAGALQYGWNFRGLYTALDPPASVRDALAQFWFDVTKSDWRETLVNNVSETGLQTRPSMYWFDLRQQIGLPGVWLAAVGAVYISAKWPAEGLLLILFYAANMAFAWTYNVGDAYIFFMPAHYAAILACAGGVAAAVRAVENRVGHLGSIAAAMAMLAYGAWRAYDTFPVVDRSGDRRAEELLNPFAGPSAVYGVDANWQIQNAFEYFFRERRPGTAWFAVDDLAWPAHQEAVAIFVRDNHAAGRRVLATELAVRRLRARGFRISADAGGPPGGAVAHAAAAMPRGTPYVLAVLRADREFPVSPEALALIWSRLLPQGHAPPPLANFAVIAGLAGEAPVLAHASDTPFRVRTAIGALQVDIRMESWLPTDTIRRAGFGHVVVDRRHRLTIERGLSLAGLHPDGPVAYEAGLFEPIRLFELIAP